jgi:formate dehydrogenase subunit gamma
MTQPAEPRQQTQLLRFTRAVRWVHGVTGALLITCILTAAILYNGSLAVIVGNRYLVEQVHVYCGFALPVPLLVGLLSRSYRLDLRRLNRFSSLDWKWLRSRTRRDGEIPVGKFNAGQKLNAALSAGAIGALLITGTVMYFTNLSPLSWRSGATFVHDWFSLGLGLLVVGHILYATRDPVAMQGMRTGLVPLRWARRQHAAWVAEYTGEPLPARDDDQVSRPASGSPP